VTRSIRMLNPSFGLAASNLLIFAIHFPSCTLEVRGASYPFRVNLKLSLATSRNLLVFTYLKVWVDLISGSRNEKIRTRITRILQ
jgi:hypothetical protein